MTNVPTVHPRNDFVSVPADIVFIVVTSEDVGPLIPVVNKAIALASQQATDQQKT